jgi:hypothetical protein
MAEQLPPTYRVEQVDDVTRYVCIVPDAGHEDGICGHWATDFQLFTNHQVLRHAGQMVEEPAGQPVAGVASKSEKTPQAPARQSKTPVVEQQAVAAKE